MSNNLASQQLLIPGNQVPQLEPISSKLGTPMSMGLMGFGIDESLQQQIPSNTVIGQMGSVSSNILGSQLSSMSNQQFGYVESQAYTQLSQQYLLSNKSVGEVIPTMLGSMRPHQLPTLNKRKEPMEPIAPNAFPKKLSLPNKHVAQTEHRPWLQSLSAPSKRPVQMQSVSSSPGSEPSPTSIKRSVPNKIGSSASRNQPAQMRQSSNVQTESFQSVRSKMRESLAGALALVSQQQGKNSMTGKNSNGEAASFAGNTDGGSHPVDSGSGLSDAARSVSTEPQGILISDQAAGGGGNNSDGTRVVQCNEQQFQSSNLLADEDVQFTENVFARDELLQGNGLSWVLESELVAVKKTATVRKQDLDNEKMGKDGQQSLQSPQELACQIEAELFKLFGGVNKKYKEKGRSLLFNLKDRSNPELRESVVSGKITPHRLCSMSAEELASKELSEWRQAKAEEFAQMVVLPDVEVDIRRLVRKTHKGEFQVEVEQTDNASVEVSAETSTFGRSKTEAKKAPRTIKTVGKKDKSDSAGENSNLEDPNLTITIPSSEGPDPMQELMGEDEIKDAGFFPPIVSLDEFMQSLDSEPPFENIPDEAGKATTLSDKDGSEAGSDSKSSRQASQVPVKVMPDKPGSTDASNLKSDSDVKLNDIPTKTETIVSEITASKGEHVWEGMLQLNVSTMTSVTCTFKSGERTSTKEWPSILEIKGRVRLDAFEKFLKELPMSRSRAVMVVHVACKDGTTESERQSLVEVADSYISDGRTGFAEPAYGVELYCCPLFARTLEILTKILSKDQVQALSALDNGLMGVVVWRKAQLTSPNSTSHHKHTSKRQHFTSIRHKDKDGTNVNSNSPSKQLPLSTRGGHLHPKPTPDDDEGDDVPPGFGPGTCRDEDDLPEFNFSGGSNTLGPQYSVGYQFQQGHVASPRLHSQTSPRPVDQMRELIQKYGQSNSNAPLGAPMQQWNNNDDDDDDDIPEWQPTSQQQPPPLQVNRFQQPMNAPHQTMHVQGQQNAAQQWQQGTYWVPAPGSQSQQFVNVTGQPSRLNDAPNNRGS